MFAVLFSEPVTGFAANDVSLGGTAPGTLVAQVAGSGANYTVQVSGMTGEGTVTVTIPAGSAHDGAGNPSTASTSTDNTVVFTVDGMSPSVTVDQSPQQPDPTMVSPIVFAVTFSEPVTGFTAGDVAFNGTAPGTLVADVAGSGASYTISVSGMTGDGSVTVSIPAGAAQDAAGNPSTASTSTDNTVSFTVDTTQPSVTIDQAQQQVDPTTASPILFSVVFSEPVTGFTAADIHFNGSTQQVLLSATVSGSGAQYTVSVTGMAGTGVVVVGIPGGAATDAAGNPSTAATSTDNAVSYQLP